MVCCCTTVFLGISAVVAFLIYRKFFRKRGEPEILEKNWKNDTVYLYQFGSYDTVRNISSYCLKVETFLRAFKIQYEVRETTRARSRYGLLPFVELNGEHIADSQLILERLKEHFKIEKNSARDEAVGRAVERLTENHLSVVCYKYKALDNISETIKMYAGWMKASQLMITLLTPVAEIYLSHRMKKRIFTVLGDYSSKEFEMLLRKDLNVIRDLLGDQKFLFGGEFSPADATVFSVLATNLYLPIEALPKKLLKTEYAVLEKYVDRIRDEYFPDDFTRKN